ncbi:MAG TPA: amidohydrolase family protein [Opitutaceae bacterium]|nr:amidohydrolase family protein [Opitutaceae bacterium]
MSSLSASREVPDGLFDFQINGFGGVDFQRDDLTPEGLARAVTALRRHRVTRIFATLITDEIDRLCRRFERLESFCEQDTAARSMVVGYHLEGPWLSPELGYRGAHPPKPMRAPRIEDFERLQQAASGHIRLVTLAPEWPGSPEFISHLRSRNVHVSLGHTNATEAEIDAAVRAGARFCTHLGNGTPGVLPRHDNITQRLLARDDLIACLIPDGIHLPRFVLQNFFRAKRPGSVLFTTDAMAGAGAPPGTYTIGELEIAIGADGVARQPGQNSGFAGSTLTPDEGVRRVAKDLNLPFEEAVRLWSTEAAKAFGI